MKLLLHQFIECRVKECQTPGAKNFPLIISASQVEKSTKPPNLRQVANLLDRIDLNILQQAGKSIGIKDSFPPESSITNEISESKFDAETAPALNRLGEYLFNYDIIKGQLKCPRCGRSYPILNSIVRMLYDEDDPAHKSNPESLSAEHESDQEESSTTITSTSMDEEDDNDE